MDYSIHDRIKNLNLTKHQIEEVFNAYENGYNAWESGKDVDYFTNLVECIENYVEGYLSSI